MALIKAIEIPWVSKSLYKEESGLKLFFAGIRIVVLFKMYMKHKNALIPWAVTVAMAVPLTPRLKTTIKTRMSNSNY